MVPIQIVRFSCEQVELTRVFDTGAETTNFSPPSAARFSSLLQRYGIPGTNEVRGFGGEGKVPEVLLPELDLSIGGITVKTNSAHVLTAKTTANSEWLAGRMGLDIVQQAQRVTIDFRVNKLQLSY